MKLWRSTIKACWILGWAHSTTPSSGVRSSSTPCPKELRTTPSHYYTPPSQLILGLVKESASAGSKGENPYNFKHYDIRETAVQFDDQKFEVKTNLTTGNVTRAYVRLYNEMGIQASGLDCGITLEDFKKGYSLLAFDLTADRTRIDLVSQGKVTISMIFGTALRHPVSVICLSSYDNLILQTGDRLPVTDFTMS